jgi:hypothetical protein
VRDVAVIEHADASAGTRQAPRDCRTYDAAADDRHIELVVHVLEIAAFASGRQITRPA